MQKSEEKWQMNILDQQLGCRKTLLRCLRWSHQLNPKHRLRCGEGCHGCWRWILHHEHDVKQLDSHLHQVALHLDLHEHDLWCGYDHASHENNSLLQHEHVWNHERMQCQSCWRSSQLQRLLGVLHHVCWLAQTFSQYFHRRCCMRWISRRFHWIVRWLFRSCCSQRCIRYRFS